MPPPFPRESFDVAEQARTVRNRLMHAEREALSLDAEAGGLLGSSRRLRGEVAEAKAGRRVLRRGAVSRFRYSPPASTDDGDAGASSEAAQFEEESRIGCHIHVFQNVQLALGDPIPEQDHTPLGVALA